MVECKPTMTVAELRYVLLHPLVLRLTPRALDVSMVTMRIAATPVQTSLRNEGNTTVVLLKHKCNQPSANDCFDTMQPIWLLCILQRHQCRFHFIPQCNQPAAAASNSQPS